MYSDVSSLLIFHCVFAFDIFHYAGERKMDPASGGWGAAHVAPG